MTTPVYESVAYLASDKFAVFNAAGDSFASEFAPGARLRVDCGTDGVRLGTVAASSFEAASGRTVVTTTMDGGAALTANLAAVLHGNDLPESLCAHAALHALGGRDALPAAAVGVSGLVSLASPAETQAGTSATKAVTPAGLAASAKGLIATNTTICVATTGSDTTGTGAPGAPYASIARALSNIAGKLIASGVIVTIQVADGTYTVGSTIVIDHPDADKMQILGNTSAETTVAISSIDTTAKTITVAGNYVSNADATKVIAVGDIIGLTGSSTSGLNGAYVVSGITYSGGNTIITCSAATFVSSAVGGGNIVIKPCNRCKISSSSGGFAFIRPLLNIDGLRIDGPGSETIGLLFGTPGKGAVGANIILNGFTYGLYSSSGATVYFGGMVIRGASQAVVAVWNGTAVQASGVLICDTVAYAGVVEGKSFIFIYSNVIIRNCSVTSFSPPAGTVGNSNSYVRNS